MKEPPSVDRTTGEVGDEGGTHGEVEVEREQGFGVGSEAGETWRPAEAKQTEVRRNETGEGKRSP